MLATYQDSNVPSYLDALAVELLAEGRANFIRYKLDKSPCLN